MSELDYLKKILDGSINIDHVAAPLVDYPEYLAWKDFAPGAKVTYVSRTWVQHPLVAGQPGDGLVRGPINERHSFTLKSLTADQVNLWLTEYPLDAGGGTSGPPHDTEMAYRAKIALRPLNPAAAPAGRSTQGKAKPAPGAQSAGPSVPAPAAENTGPYAPAPTIPEETLISPQRLRFLAVDPEPTAQDSGEEILDIQGRKILTTWRSATYTIKPSPSSTDGTVILKIWTSDAVPTHLVRKTVDEIHPTVEPRSRFPARSRNLIGILRRLHAHRRFVRLHSEGRALVCPAPGRAGPGHSNNPRTDDSRTRSPNRRHHSRAQSTSCGPWQNAHHHTRRRPL